MKHAAFKKLVEDFLTKQGMAATTFGRKALSDPGFVSRMRKGARCWPETQERCLSFMEKFASKEEPAK